MQNTRHSRAMLAGIVLAGLVLTAQTALAQMGLPGEATQQGHNDFYRFASRYWWLIFPVMSMIWGMIDLAAKHRRAREGLHLIKSYIDQGKEPPPELLKLLDTKANVYGNSSGSGRSAWPGVFLFAALCAGFLMFAYWPGGLDFEPRQIAALHFVALIMGGLCVGCLVMTLRSERDRTPRP